MTHLQTWVKAWKEVTALSSYQCNTGSTGMFGLVKLSGKTCSFDLIDIQLESRRTR